MTNTPSEYVPRPASARVHLPTSGWVHFIVSPGLLVIGALLTRFNANLTFDWVVFPTSIGLVTFGIGLASLAAGFVLLGVRAIAQRQVDILLGVERQ